MFGTLVVVDVWLPSLGWKERWSNSPGASLLAMVAAGAVVAAYLSHASSEGSLNAPSVTRLCQP
jgi:hypothetical protein